MNYVPNYKKDIFVSYAHVDNDPFPGIDKGWVTTLIESLKIKVGQLLGRSDSFELWMDHDLSRHDPVTEQIIDTLNGTATIVVIMSPGYIASEWCNREIKTFLNFVKDKVRNGSRIFMIEHDCIDRDERPQEFRELLGYPFWIKDREGKFPKTLGIPKPMPNDQKYYDILNDLGNDLANELKRLKTIYMGVDISKLNTQSKYIFLAEVTDDLEPQRDDIKRYLNQHNLRILPESMYPRDPAQFQEAVRSDLVKSKLFVQLVSNILGKKPPGQSTTYTHLQYECAIQSDIPVLQWRSRDLDMSQITNVDHRELLEKAMAVGIEDFKRDIVERTCNKPPAIEKKSVNAFVFVNMATNDRTLAEKIRQCLDQHDAEYVLPLLEGKPKDIRKDLERNLLNCDGVIIVYGEITVSWVKEQLMQCRKILAKRDRPLKALAVYEGPPEPKVPLDLKLQHMHIINCRKGFKEDDLISFMESLKNI